MNTTGGRIVLGLSANRWTQLAGMSDHDGLMAYIYDLDPKISHRRFGKVETAISLR